MLLAVCRDFDIENELIPHVASGFAGGIGLSGSICGAVSGAVLAIGLVTGASEASVEKQRRTRLVQRFLRAFEAEMKTTSCRELTGQDLSTPEGLERFLRSDVPRDICRPAVDTAHRLVTELLNGASTS